MTDVPPTRPFVGLVYRAHHPRWAFAPASGEGAARHGGRFNPRGTPALYTSLDPRTAWMEAQQGLPFKAQPMTLVGYRIGCERIVDLTDPAVLATCAIEAATLACPGTGLTRPDAAELDARGALDRVRRSGRPGAQLCPRHDAG